MFRKFFLLFFLVLFSSTAFAIISSDSAKIFAVTSDGKGLSADLILNIEPGTGKSWVALDSLVGTSTQSTARTSVQLAKNYYDKVDSFDYKFDINSNASLVDGPSAGAAMALVVISALEGKKVPKNVSITGTINSDGTVGAVGGVFEKAKEAARIKMALFMIPSGEAKQIVKLPDGVKSIYLPDYALKEWGLKIVEVETIDEVLKLAFSDIQQIDVNAGSETVAPDFTPEPVKYVPQLELMHSLTKNYIDRTELDVGNAKRALNSTLLDNQNVLDSMLSMLTGSEKFLAQAKLLYDQNYLYSAANYAFLAKINAMAVKDIADNPSILTANSTVFDLKVNDLKREIEDVESKLQQSIPVDFLEWHVAAEQRISYAELNVKKLTSTKTVVIGDEGVDSETTALSTVQDYESAVAWAEIASDFYDISKNSKQSVLPESEKSLEETATKLVIASEDKLSVLTGTEFEDAQRRLDTSKLERENGWYIASAFDAASASSLVNAEIDTSGKSLEQLQLLLEKNISALDEKIRQSKYSFIWPQLYLDHGKFFLASANFYKDKNQTVLAMQSAKNGISLVYLAQSIFEVANSGYETIGAQSNISSNIAVPANANSGGNGKQSFPPLPVMIVFGSLVLIVIVLLIALFKASTRPKGHDLLESKIRQTQKMIQDMDKAFVEKKVDDSKYKDVSEKYKIELRQLLGEKENRSKHIMEMDLLRAKFSAYDHVLRDLKIHYNEGLVSSEDYKKNLEFYKKQLDLAESEVLGAEKNLETENGMKKAVEAENNGLLEKKQIGKTEKTGSTQLSMKKPLERRRQRKE